MFEKLSKGFAVFKAGEKVVEDVRLKRQQLGASIGALLIAGMALARAFGYELPLSDDQLMQLGGGLGVLLSLFNYGATVASTDKLDAVGRKAIQRVDPTDQQDEATSGTAAAGAGERSGSGAGSVQPIDRTAVSGGDPDKLPDPFGGVNGN